MPVSPQDYALWSRMTGNPVPISPAERMAIAPQVYDFNRNLGRRGAEPSGLRKVVDVVGKTALAAGAIAGAAYLGQRYGGDAADFLKSRVQGLQLDDEPQVDNDVVAAEPNSPLAVNTQDVTPPTTSDRYGQDVVLNQTAEVQAARGVSPAKPIVVDSEVKPMTQSEVIGSQQHFSRGSEEMMTMQQKAEEAAAFRKSRAYAAAQEAVQPVVQTEPTAETVRPAEEVVTVASAERAPQAVQLARRVKAVREVPVVEESSAVLPSVAPTRAVPVVTEGPSEQQIQDTLVGLRKGFAGRSEPELRDLAVQVLTKESPAPAAVVEEVEVVKPAVVAPVPFLKEKAGAVRPAATQRGTVEHAVAEAMEQREGMRQPPEGTQIFELPKGGTRQVKLYPSQQVGVVYANDPHTEYSYKSSPEYYGELEGMLKKGEFVPGGTGFIQAGKNLGYLY